MILKLDDSIRSANVETKNNSLILNSICQITYNRDSWVKLYESPSEYSSNEALLLCEKSAGIWVTWIPGYGESILNKENFYC